MQTLNRDVSFDLACASGVAVGVGSPEYAAAPPFSPCRRYPEYPFANFTVDSAPNHAYATVRETLHLLRLDERHYGTSHWNPLGEVVRPGDRVVIKPNFVRDFRESSPETADCVMTHGAVLRAVLDYVHIAMCGRGEIIIADAPHNDASFARIRALTGLDDIQRFYRGCAGLDLQVYDLRPEEAEKIDGVIVGHRALPGDPAGYVVANLGRDSMFYEINDRCEALYGSEYDTAELHRHQHDDVHEYLLSRTVLSADVVISLPKLKTHKKVGLTVNAKNLVGINGNKNWLPHHREGTPSQGGDQFAEDTLHRRIERAAVQGFKRVFPQMGRMRPVVAGPLKAVGKRIFGDTNAGVVRSGNWYGNDTTWRMVLDLNRILMYADADGRWHDRPVRRFFSLVDGIVAGEGNGPLDPTPRPAGLIIAGLNPVAVDLVCARLMGFDWEKIPMLRRALDEHRFPLARFAAGDVDCQSNLPSFDRLLSAFEGSCLAFEPHFGWKGHIEFSGQPDETCVVA
jgi:uncharacterized protein (DUF362 family)